MQKAVNLEASLTRVKSDRDLKTTEMKKKIDSLTDDLEKHKKMLRDSKDKYFDTRQELFAANDDLRKMHDLAGSTYCNTTLIMEDSTKIFSFVGSKITDFCNEFYMETLVPLSRTFSHIGEMFVERTNEYYEEYAKDHVEEIKTSVYDLYIGSIKPIIDEHILPLVEKHISPLVDKVSDPISEAVESVRLTMVSVVKHTSKAAHAYLAVLKIDKGMLSPPTEWMLKQFKYCMDNSDEVVDTVAGYLPLFFAMMVTGCVILGSIFVKLGVPTSFVWAYCVVRFLYRPRCKEVASGGTTGTTAKGKGKKKGRRKVKAQ
uniref:Uncharacterized protein n=1 Tax=Helicotheca tamesis TaxID=374047 RepID=A0A7S2E3I4_9STRA